MGYTLNLLDLAFTLHALNKGVLELNPLMQRIHLMIFYKVFVVGALFWWLGKRKEKIARIGLKICTAVYAVLLAYHCVGLFYMKG